jgi:hypothetical protein
VPQVRNGDQIAQLRERHRSLFIGDPYLCHRIFRLDK